MSQTAFGGRRLGEGADVLEAMICDENCFRVVTVSGAMTIAKQGLLLCEMIDRGWIHALVTTAALMTHGLSEGAGLLHFKHKPGMRDEDLYQRGYNRVYDTIELEKNLDDVEQIPQRALQALPEDTVLSSHLICKLLGRDLEKNSPAAPS
jgi:deoxyhypusine synthase